jgi:hypothetical protein
VEADCNENTESARPNPDLAVGYGINLSDRRINKNAKPVIAGLADNRQAIPKQMRQQLLPHSRLDGRKHA